MCTYGWSHCISWILSYWQLWAIWQRCWKLSSGPLEEQVLLTAKLFLQPPIFLVWPHSPALWQDLLFVSSLASSTSSKTPTLAMTVIPAPEFTCRASEDLLPKNLELLDPFSAQASPIIYCFPGGKLFPSFWNTNDNYKQGQTSLRDKSS